MKTKLLKDSAACRSVPRILRTSLPLALCSATLLTHTTNGQTWQAVDDFQFAPGQDAENCGLAVTPNATLHASGLARDSAGLWHALVIGSSNAGLTWSTLDDYDYAQGYQAWYDGGMVADSAGNLYVGGEAWSDTDPANHWIVRRTTNGGATWSLVDDFAPGSVTAQPFGVTADPAGNVYVIGMANHVGLNDNVWTVRKGVGGTSFATVDTFNGYAEAIFAHPSAGIFAVGSTSVPGSKRNTFSTAWIVRRSTDGGVTWSVVDTFQLSQGLTSRAYGIGVDGHGNLHVVGQGYVASGPKDSYSHWVVRKSNNGGASWSTVDNFQLATSGFSQASLFFADSNGNLYVGGVATTGSAGVYHWIVRTSPGGTGTWSTDDDFQYTSGFYTWPLAIVANPAGHVFVGGWGGSGTGEHWLVRRK